MIRVDTGVKNALTTLLQHAIDVGDNGTIDPLIAHLPKLKPGAGKSRTISWMVEVLLRQAGYSWDSNRVWLTAVPDKKAERRATAGPTTSRAATPRVAMQQLPSNLEHDAGTPTEATRAADAARPPEPGVMATTAPETLERLGPRGSSSVARPLEECFFDELVSTSYSIEPHLPWPTRGPSALSPQPSLVTLSGGNIGEGETGGGWFGGGNAGLCELGGGRLGGGDAGGGEAGGGWLGDDDAAGGEAGGRIKRRRGSRGAGGRAVRGRCQ